jgi:hypothetical protein
MARTIAHPIACSLDRSAFRGRLDEFRAVLRRGFIGAERLPDRARWRFRAAPGLEDDLRKLAERERRCCRFFLFDIRRVDEEIWWDTRVDRAEALPVLDLFFALPSELAASE